MNIRSFAIKLADWGWRSCVVYTNEVNSEIWRTNDAMSSLRSSGLDSLWHQSGCPTLPLPSLPTDLSNTTTRQNPALKQQACQRYIEGMRMRAVGRVLGIHHKTVSRWLVQLPSTPSKPNTD